ncbi:UDP-N-acetylmuramate dehydrogenase [Candidatus Saccharibacteria bacterium]|nr:UDP-N-acetylmuramate dehydrogenase [Candidatus Saccharibacteria bacterium]
MLDLPNLQTNVPLAPLTTYKIGGPADMFVTVHSAAELTAAVTAAKGRGIPYFVLGTGANILVSDAGFRGLVIHNRAKSIEVDTERLQVTAESGATIGEVIAAAAELDLGNLEYFTVVPSSVGGGVRQNFHFVEVDAAQWAASGEIVAGETQYLADRVTAGVVLDEAGKVHHVDHAWFEFTYDYSLMLDRPVILLATTFQMTRRPRAQIEQQIAASAAWRAAKQPLLADFPSCGSVFINIPGVGAGRLIDQAGLKGRSLGNVQVSPKHANYLVNLGGATAADVRGLIEAVQQEVQAATGQLLETEIGFVGDWSTWRS